MNQPAENPSPVPRGRRGTTARRTSIRPRMHTDAAAQEPVSEQPRKRAPRHLAIDAMASVAAVPAPRVELDAVTVGRGARKSRGRGMAAFASSGWVRTLTALILITGTAALVRFVGLSQIGFNSDEAVYSGQAAAIAGFQPYGQLFGVFRAHPLLVQFTVALGYALSGHVSDWLPRAVTASFGVGLALTCWGIGMVLRGRFLGFAMGMIAALCPYAVVVSRQMLLDGPMTTFVAATMLMLALWLRTHRVVWFYAAAGTAALAVLAKEMGMLTVPAVILFVLFSRDLPLRWRRDLPIAGAVFLVAISPYPLSLVLGGGAHTTNQFVVWQFFRQPNHDAWFYLTVLPSLGYVTVALAAFGLASLRWRWQKFDALAISLVLCNVVFFQIWPTKGFEYMLPLVPPVVYLAGRGALALGELGPSIARPLRLQHVRWRWAAAAALSLALISMAPPAVGVAASPRQAAVAAIATDSDFSEPGTAVRTFLAGTGGLRASRPSGEWVRTHTLPSARFLTIGPSFANVIQFYGQRKALALSVSPNPLHRNPQYEPVLNADAAIRSGSIQYLIYDSYSASRSPFFAKQMMSYVTKFRGVAVFSFREDGPKQPADVVIYEVHP